MIMKQIKEQHYGMASLTLTRRRLLKAKQNSSNPCSFHNTHSKTHSYRFKMNQEGSHTNFGDWNKTIHCKTQPQTLIGKLKLGSRWTTVRRKHWPYAPRPMLSYFFTTFEGKVSAAVNRILRKCKKEVGLAFKEPIESLWTRTAERHLISGNKMISFKYYLSYTIPKAKTKQPSSVRRPRTITLPQK